MFSKYCIIKYLVIQCKLTFDDKDVECYDFDIFCESKKIIEKCVKYEFDIDKLKPYVFNYLLPFTSYISKNWYIILKVVKLVKQDDEVTNNTNTTKIWFKQKTLLSSSPYYNST